MVVGATLILLVHFGNSRVFLQMRPSRWKIDERWASARQLIDDIPAKAPVAAQVDLVAHVPVRPIRYMIPKGLAKADYVLFDTEGNAWPLGRDENLLLLRELRASGEWADLAARDGFVLLKRE